MKDENMIYVRHPKYGRGYVFVIGEDCFAVKFRWGLKRVQFPLTAMKDDTLVMTDDARARFWQRHKILLEHVHKSKLAQKVTTQEE